MKTKKNKLYFNYTIIILTILAVFYSVIETVLDNNYLNKDSSYAISDKISLTTVGKGGTNKQYTFFLKGKWYAGSTTLPLHRDGTKYFIKFYPPNPNRNEATKVLATPEDIKNLPPDGYKKLPHQ